MANRRVKRTRGGQYELRLAPEERELLRGLAPRMREVLTDEEDPALERLFPAAYTDDEDRQTEYRLLAHDELLASHLGALATLEESVDAERLDGEQLLAWMRALNEVRLVMGVRLGVTEEGDERRDVTAGDARGQSFAIYDYLTDLQAEIIDTLAR